MENILATKETILTKLRENRDAHHAIFEEAVVGYREACINTLNEHIKLVQSGKVYNLRIELPVPVDRTKDYDRAITMIELAIGDTIELSEADVQCFVMDDWQWKQHFLASNAGYSATAAAAL